MVRKTLQTTTRRTSRKKKPDSECSSATCDYAPLVLLEPVSGSGRHPGRDVCIRETKTESGCSSWRVVRGFSSLLVAFWCTEVLTGACIKSEVGNDSCNDSCSVTTLLCPTSWKCKVKAYGSVCLAWARNGPKQASLSKLSFQFAPASMLRRFCLDSRSVSHRLNDRDATLTNVTNTRNERT